MPVRAWSGAAPGRSLQRRRQVRGIRHRRLAGEVPADVQCGLPIDEALPAKQRQVRRRRAGGVVVRDDPVGKKPSGEGAAERLESRRARRPDEGHLDRTLQEEVHDGETPAEGPRVLGDGPAVGLDGPDGGFPEVGPVQVAGQAGEHRGGHGVAARDGTVGAVLVPDDERLVVPRRVVEAARAIPEVRQDAFGEARGVPEVADVAAGLVQVQEAFGQEGIVFEIRVQMRLPRAIGPEQPAVGPPQRGQQKVGRPRGRRQIAGLAQDPRALRHRPQHHPVPRREDLVVQPGRNPLSAGLVQPGAPLLDAPPERLHGDPQAGGDPLDRARRVRDALPLPVAFVGDVEKGAEPAALFRAQDRLHLGRRPDDRTCPPRPRSRRRSPNRTRPRGRPSPAGCTPGSRGRSGHRRRPP